MKFTAIKKLECDRICKKDIDSNMRYLNINKRSLNFDNVHVPYILYSVKKHIVVHTIFY